MIISGACLSVIALSLRNFYRLPLQTITLNQSARKKSFIFCKNVGELLSCLFTLEVVPASAARYGTEGLFCCIYNLKLLSS